MPPKRKAHRKGGSRRFRKHKRATTKTTAVLPMAGTLVAVYGATVAPFDNGDSAIARAKRGDLAGALSLANPLEMVGKSGGAGISDRKKELVYGGLVLLGLGVLAPKLPLVGRPLKKYTTFKSGRHVYSLFGR